MSTAYTKLISRTATNLISLSDAKGHLRILDNAQDAMVQTVLNAAIRYAETRTERLFATTVYEIRIPAEAGTIVLPYPDFKSVDEVKTQVIGADPVLVYNDQTGTLSDFITVDDWLNPAEITVKDNAADFYIIKVTFGVDEIAEDLEQAIKMMMTHFYDNPREVEVGRTANKVPMGADMILGMYEFKRYG